MKNKQGSEKSYNIRAAIDFILGVMLLALGTCDIVPEFGKGIKITCIIFALIAGIQGADNLKAARDKTKNLKKK